MKTNRLGNSDLWITPVGFGAWAIGGAGWEFAWGAQDDRDSIAAIHEALNAGINWIDTAAVYGLGHSEEVVARALAGIHERPYVFTKCSMIWNEHRQISRSLKADSIRRECEASLRRLRVDTIDLYQIHWPEPERPEAPSKSALDSIWNTLTSEQQREVESAAMTSALPHHLEGYRRSELAGHHCTRESYRRLILERFLSTMNPLPAK